MGLLKVVKEEEDDEDDHQDQEDEEDVEEEEEEQEEQEEEEEEQEQEEEQENGQGALEDDEEQDKKNNKTKEHDKLKDNDGKNEDENDDTKKDDVAPVVKAENNAEEEEEESTAAENGKQKIANPKKRKLIPITNQDELIRAGTIRRIMKLDREVKMTGSEAVYLVSKATELFIGELAGKAYEFAEADDDRKFVKYDDVVRSVRDEALFDFLINLIPEITSNAVMD